MPVWQIPGEHDDHAYPLGSNRVSYVPVASVEAVINGQQLVHGDADMIDDEPIELSSPSEGELLLFDLSRKASPA